jgi:hypothetical protein
VNECCCKPFEKAVSRKAIEWHRGWNVGDPDAGSYLFCSIRFCPFCGEELRAPVERQERERVS